MKSTYYTKVGSLLGTVIVSDCDCGLMHTTQPNPLCIDSLACHPVTIDGKYSMFEDLNMVIYLYVVL